MKKILFFLMLVITVIATSCTSVDSKERGVKKSWGGEVDVKNVYEPGMHYGANWLWDDMITFDVSQQTIVEKAFGETSKSTKFIKFLNRKL